MRTQRPLKQRINPQFRELAPDAFVQFSGEEDFVGVGLLEVDVDVEAAAGAVGDGVGEGGVGAAGVGGGGVDVGFGVWAGGFAV